jgi:hypothetical protein
MVEIAISLGVIAFALVAIIGVLPIGLGAQRANRQETIINQDEKVFMDAIRNGSGGLDDLTNYVQQITVSRALFDHTGKLVGSNLFLYTYFGSSNLTISSPTPVSTPTPFPLTNGYNIVGLLSTPKIIPTYYNGNPAILSNYVAANVYSLSGPASEKAPQSNPDVQSLALTYRMVCEILPFAEYDPYWTNTSLTVPGFIPLNRAHSNYWASAGNLQTNLYNVRLLFRWPLVNPGGTLGPGRQSYRTMVGGQQVNNLPGNFALDATIYTNLYFFTPRIYTNCL